MPTSPPALSLRRIERAAPCLYLASAARVWRVSLFTHTSRWTPFNKRSRGGRGGTGPTKPLATHSEKRRGMRDAPLWYLCSPFVNDPTGLTTSFFCVRAMRGDPSDHLVRVQHSYEMSDSVPRASAGFWCLRGGARTGGQVGGPKSSKTLSTTEFTRAPIRGCDPYRAVTNYCVTSGVCASDVSVSPSTTFQFCVRGDTLRVVAIAMIAQVMRRALSMSPPMPMYLTVPRCVAIAQVAIGRSTRRRP